MGVGDVVAVVIVFDSRLDGFLRQYGAVQLISGQTAQRIHHLLVGDGQRFLNGLALDELSGHGGGRDGAAAAEGLELRILNAVILDLQVHFHNIAALGVAYLAYAVGVGDLAHIPGMGEMVHDGFCIKCHIESLLGL